MFRWHVKPPARVLPELGENAYPTTHFFRGIIMQKGLLVSVVAAAFISAPAFAAKPKKFVSGGEVTLESGAQAEASIVTCTNRQEFTLLRIDGQWCVDEAGSYCSKKRMKAAKKACK